MHALVCECVVILPRALVLRMQVLDRHERSLLPVWRRALLSLTALWLHGSGAAAGRLLGLFDGVSGSVRAEQSAVAAAAGPAETRCSSLATGVLSPVRVAGSGPCP
ncbi:hypothetical protein NDU88_002856 [Pleurodeles waltl]|uniref:Secreted protein n=1 Tax=Pleurodeles waltl TaxID=8319 RepID=A0AAV7NEY1_PLEWA|nr:hypothetical protein NDU88_002856 [Pleurodeles waltl]